MATTRTVTFEVDQGVLFDILHQMGGDTAPLGARVVSVLLADPSMIEHLGLAAYGIIVSSEGEA